MAWDNNAETLLGEELTNILDSNDISVYSAEQTENGMSIGLEFYSDLGEDMVIPTTMVQIVQMESSGRHDIVKDNIGYSVDDTYGFVGTQWQDSYKGITDEAPTLAQENMKETYEKLNNFEPEKDDVIKDDKEDDFGLD